MTRPRPIPRLAWTTRTRGRTGSASLDPHVAYYRIAKSAVLEKYPAWLHQAEVGAEDVEGWPPDLRTLRAAKAELLFFSDPHFVGDSHFDERRWRSFIHRVASYLRFVDRRRGERATTHAHYADVPAATLERDYQRAEREASTLLEFAQGLREEILRRANGGRP